MAKIVCGVASSHTPMINTRSGLWDMHAKRDHANTSLHYRGKVYAFDELKSLRAGEGFAAECTQEVWDLKQEKSEAAIARLAAAYAQAAPDLLVVFGDDQNELYTPQNIPAISVFWGERATYHPKAIERMPPSIQAAYEKYGREPEEYVIATGLARHVIDHLMAEDFDLAQMGEQPEDRSIGHAFTFIRERIMGDRVVPILPVMLNTYFPPNQPSAARCYRLGQAVARAVASWPEDVRVGIAASGGLTHFVIDAEFDQHVLHSLQAHDADAICRLPKEELNSGNSEIRNWIATAGALEGRRMELLDYIPAYRTEAGTGCGMAFAYWN